MSVSPRSQTRRNRTAALAPPCPDRARHAWVWRDPQFDDFLAEPLFDFAMSLQSRDRFHAKQGRSTARVALPSRAGCGTLSVYLKRHWNLGRWAAWLACFPFGQRRSPAAVEWANLHRAQSLGVRVPIPIACGERVSDRLEFQSFLMIAELVGLNESHIVIPALSTTLDPARFEQWKRRFVRALARLVAKLHDHALFHKDLYLCHIFVPEDGAIDPAARMTLIDLHRLARHRVLPTHWLVKDLGQLLFSTFGVAGVSQRDRLRFWSIYARLRRLPTRGWLARQARWKADLYARHESHRKERQP